MGFVVVLLPEKLHQQFNDSAGVQRQIHVHDSIVFGFVHTDAYLLDILGSRRYWLANASLHILPSPENQ